MSEILRQQIEEITSLTDEEFEYVLSHFETKKLIASYLGVSREALSRFNSNSKK